MTRDRWSGAGEEIPSPRADVKVHREPSGIRSSGHAGPVNGEARTPTGGTSRSSPPVAATMLLLATAACIPAVVLGVGGCLIHMRAMPLGCAVLAVFIAVFATGVALAVRRNELTAFERRFQPPASEQPLNGLTDGEQGRLDPLEGTRRADGNGTTQAIGGSARRTPPGWTRPR